MGKIKKIILYILIITTVLIVSSQAVFGVTWEFGSSGSGINPFTPRGYFVDTGKGLQWLSSPYSNESPVIKYTGKDTGLDYIYANEDYKLYAMTDRGLTPNGIYKGFLVAWKDGTEISGFGDLAGSSSRVTTLDPSGNNTCSSIPIDGFKFEPGCKYEFGFLRGMRANNGITLVLSEDNKGYIQQPKGGSLTSAEQEKYDKDKDEVYEFMISYNKAVDEEGNNTYSGFNMIPMKFTVQTYADMSIWNDIKKEVERFVDSVKESDYTSGKYSEDNVERLKSRLKYWEALSVKEGWKKELQASSEKDQNKAKNDLNRYLKLAKAKAKPANLDELNEKIKEAQTLYEKVKNNTGIKDGQYGAIEVENLDMEIIKAKKLHIYSSQIKIDNEVIALDDAIIEVKASIVQEAVRIFYDKGTGIYIIVPEGALPQEIKLFVTRISEKATTYKNMVKHLSKEETIAKMYDIKFYKGTNSVKPKKEVQVQMPTADSMEGMATCVYSVGQKGDIEKLESAKANGIRIYKTSTLGKFVLTAQKQTNEDKSKTNEDKSKNNTSKKKSMSVMKQTPKVSKKNQEDKELKKDKKLKEEYKTPLANNIKEKENNAKYNKDVTRTMDSKYLIFVAIALAIVALGIGVRLLIWRKKKNEI